MFKKICLFVLSICFLFLVPNSFAGNQEEFDKINKELISIGWEYRYYKARMKILETKDGKLKK